MKMLRKFVGFTLVFMKNFRIETKRERNIKSGKILADSFMNHMTDWHFLVDTRERWSASSLVTRRQSKQLFASSNVVHISSDQATCLKLSSEK
jgi:hypothetical protein